MYFCGRNREEVDWLAIYGKVIEGRKQSITSSRKCENLPSPQDLGFVASLAYHRRPMKPSQPQKWKSPETDKFSSRYFTRLIPHLRSARNSYVVMTG